MKHHLFYGIGVELVLLCLLIFGESIVPLLLMLAIPLISGISLLLARCFGKHISVSLEMEDLSEPGEVLKGRLLVKNDGRIAFPLICVVIETKNLLTGETSYSDIPVSVPANREIVTDFEWDISRCGRVRSCVQKVKVFDLFGFFSIPVLCTAKKKALILPEIFPMDITVTKSGAVEPECDTFSPYKAGNDPTETFGIRDYEPGDPLRSIHWKLTGKYDRLMIREAGLPVNESVLILFERICPASASVASPDVRAALGEIAVSLSHRLVEMNIAHTIGWLRAENGTFLGHRVDSEESFQLVMAEVLSVYEMRGEEDTIESYLKTNDLNTYSNIVYLSAHDSENLSLLPHLVNKTTILCSERAFAADTTDRLYAVTPSDHASSLYQIYI